MSSTTKILGIAEGSHDAAWCWIEGSNIIEAHHAERHTRKKNDKWINPSILPQGWFDVIGHEDKVRVNERRLYAGQGFLHENVTVDGFYNHYETHAWAGWATAPFDDCDILCIDAIGEFESAAVFKVRDKIFTKTWEMKYPQSLGLIYSAITAGLGYKPMEDEYIVMGLAAYGEPIIDFEYLLDENCHKGIKLPKGRPEDIAASVQALYEKHLLILIDKYCKHKNLILMGGCALNCVANGPAEFGPRALGNRSLLADPRLDIKDTVNEIKRRQRFRPFAPAILEEYANEYFKGPMNEYMQFIAKAKHDYKSVTHVDGTARVQIVKLKCKSVIRPILEEWYELTGCPMLLNTSLNIKGEPMVDTWEHALDFEKKYSVKVF